MVYWIKEALRRNCRLKQRETFFSPYWVCLFSRNPTKRGGMLVRSGPSSPDSGRTGGGSGIPGSRSKRVRLRRKTQFMRFFENL